MEGDQRGKPVIKFALSHSLSVFFFFFFHLSRICEIFDQARQMHRQNTQRDYDSFPLHCMDIFLFFQIQRLDQTAWNHDKVIIIIINLCFFFLFYLFCVHCSPASHFLNTTIPFDTIIIKRSETNKIGAPRKSFISCVLFEVEIEMKVRFMSFITTFVSPQIFFWFVFVVTLVSCFHFD